MGLEGEDSQYAVVGPRSITAGRGAYAEVINQTEDQQILNALVRTRYDETFGMISVASEQGIGTKITITLPITLAIIRALILKVGGQEFAIPTAAIDETLRIDPDSIVKVEGREIVRRCLRFFSK